MSLVSGGYWQTALITEVWKMAVLSGATALAAFIGLIIFVREDLNH